MEGDHVKFRTYLQEIKHFADFGKGTTRHNYGCAELKVENRHRPDEVLVCPLANMIAHGAGL